MSPPAQFADVTGARRGRAEVVGIGPGVATHRARDARRSPPAPACCSRGPMAVAAGACEDLASQLTALFSGPGLETFAGDALPLMDLSMAGGLPSLAGMPSQFAMYGAPPGNVGQVSLPALNFLPIHLPPGFPPEQPLASYVVGKGHGLQVPEPVAGYGSTSSGEEHPQAAGQPDARPAAAANPFFNVHYQRLLQMQAQQAQQAQQVQEEATEGGAAFQAEQTLATAPLPLSYCAPGQPGSGHTHCNQQQQRESSGALSAAATASSHKPCPEGADAGDSWEPEPALLPDPLLPRDHEGAAAAAAAEEAGLPSLRTGRRRTRSMSQQETDLAVVAAAGAAVDAYPGPAATVAVGAAAAAAGAGAGTAGPAAGLGGGGKRRALAEREHGKGGEAAAEEEGSDWEAASKKRRRRRGPPAALGGSAAAGSAANGASGKGEGEGEGEAKKERSSKFRGVTKHRRSGRYEAHIWVKELGRQVYLGGYEQEEHAAEAYDIASLKARGKRVTTNFPLDKYSDLLSCIDRMSMEELVMAVRRQSQGFSRGSSSFRGVTLHPSARFEARIGVPGSKHIYLGLWTEEADAARAYDRALVRLRGRSAATNFSLSDYRGEMSDYHTWQSGMLKEDGRFAEIQGKHDLFEKWVKGGCESFPDLGSRPLASEAGEGPSLAQQAIGQLGQGQQEEQEEQEEEEHRSLAGSRQAVENPRLTNQQSRPGDMATPGH